MTVLTTTERKRLLQAIVYFAANTAYCGKIKLFKLLYLLDFEHFRQTGRSATGLDYQAWKFGPVPIELMEEWEELGDDMAQLVHIVEERVFDYDRQTVHANADVVFDPDDFTERQLRIMQGLVDQYKDTYSPKMIDVTHAQNGAWDKAWRGGQGARAPIPYELALDAAEPQSEQILMIAREQAMYRDALLASRRADFA